MKVTPVTGDCHDGSCPTVHRSDRGTLVFQGYSVLQAEGLLLTDGEQAVELPESVVREAVRALGW